MEKPAIRCLYHPDEPVIKAKGFLDDFEVGYRPRMPATVYRCPNERCEWRRFDSFKEGD